MVSGSSPRMRGKLGHCHGCYGRARIIPAHAGQTSGHPAWSVPGTDHPRACGANLANLSHKRIRDGSSPRMRGKPGGRTQRLEQRRIIPAHAGQTCLRSIRLVSVPDHPRACGANVDQTTIATRENGSSPRMRGKLSVIGHHRGDGRIIPAHAGQTSTYSLLRMRWTDHPRACGANNGRA